MPAVTKRLLVALVVVPALAACLWAWTWTVSERFTLDRAALSRYGAVGATIRLPDPKPGYSSMSEAVRPGKSGLILFENNVALVAPHAMHAEIGQIGAGRYSHWGTAGKDGDWIIFSASDSSDPLTNGRAYSVLRPLTINTGISWAVTAGTSVLVLVSFLLFRRTVKRDARSILAFARRCSPILFDGNLVASTPRWVEMGVAATFAVTAVGIYWSMLKSGYTSGLAIAAYFPISDASGYWACANEYLEYGEGDYWCHRRPLYSMILGTISLLSGRNLEVVLIIQAALLGLCVYLFAREVGRWLGWAAALFSSYVILHFSTANAIGATMSEVGGLYAGLIAGALLLRAAERKSLSLGLLGVFMFGLGENIRPGALLAIPIVIIWVATLRGINLRSVVVAGSLGVAAIAASFAIHSTFVMLTGGDPTNSFGNTAQTVYGLSVGGNWTELGNDHPELLLETAENSRETYRLAFENMRSHPDIVAQAIASNISLHMSQQWTNLAAPVVPALPLYVMGFCVVAVTSWRSPRARLVAAVLIGELVSASLIVHDGGTRIWAATGPIAQVLPSMLAVACIARWIISSAMNIKVDVAVSEPLGSPWPVSARAAGVLALFIAVPVVHSIGVTRADASVLAGKCAPNLDARIIDLSEAADMTISSTFDHPASFPRRIGPDDLIQNMIPGLAYADSFSRLKEIRLIRGVADAPKELIMPGFYAPLDMKIPESGRVVVCADPAQSIEVAVFRFDRIVAAYRLDN